ncbi:MAG: hypothetical protein R3E66_16890 [bacterium]
MLPYYLIYDELERLRREEHPNQDERPHLELPLYMPYWEETEEKNEEKNNDSNVIIMQM